MNKKYIISALIVGLLLGIIAGLYFAPKPETEYIQTEVLRRDTVLIEKILPGDVIYLQGKPQILTTKDTIIETLPFMAVLDTVIVKDTVTIHYYYPENDFYLWLRTAPDTIRVPQYTIIERPKECKKAWHEETWFRIATHVGTALMTAYIVKEST